MIFAFKIFFRELYLMLYARITGYYKNIHKISIYRWAEIYNGDYTKIYKKPIRKVPEYFKSVQNDLCLWQLETLDMAYFEKITKIAQLRAWYILTKKPQYLNSSNFLIAELKKNKDSGTQKLELNKLVNFVEKTFKQIGSIDVHKMTAGRFLSLYEDAKNEVKVRSHGNN